MASEQRQFRRSSLPDEMSQTQKISRNNTVQTVQPDGAKSVILHSTEVIRYWPEDRKVRLNTGGWNTVTTKTRMNQALNEWGIPACVYSRKGVFAASVRESIGTLEVQFSRDGICYFNF